MQLRMMDPLLLRRSVLLGMAAVAIGLASPIHAQDEVPELSFLAVDVFPGTHIRLEGPPHAPPEIIVRIRTDDGGTKDLAVSRAADGKYPLDFRCARSGRVTFEVYRGPESQIEGPASQFAIMCRAPPSAPEPESMDESAPAARSASAATSTPTPAPEGTAGRLESYLYKFELVGSRYDQNLHDLRTKDSTMSHTIVAGNGQLCHLVTLANRACRTTSSESTCSTSGSGTSSYCSAAALYNVTDMIGGSDGPLARIESYGIPEHLETYRATSDLTMSWIFPTVPASQSIEAVSLVATGGLVYGNLGSLPATALGAEAVIPILPPGAWFTGSLTDPCWSAGVSQMRWLLPGPQEGRRIEVRIKPEVKHTCTGPGYKWQRGGEQFARFSAFTSASPLTLAPDHLEVTPKAPRGQEVPNAKPQTAVRATLQNASPGPHPIRVRLESFDAEIAGHEHGAPPPEYWGKLSAGSSGGQEASCTIEIGESGQGSCDLMYTTREIAGRVKLIGETDGVVPASAFIDVRVPELFRVNDGLGTDDILHFLRNPDIKHSDTVAFWLNTQANYQMLRFGEAYRLITQLARTGVYPEGLILAPNDMSLPWGGKFDIAGGWTGEHSWHQKGTSVDLNRGSYDRANPQTRAPDLGDATTSEVRLACARAGGALIPERDPLKLHCEFRPL